MISRSTALRAASTFFPLLALTFGCSQTKDKPRDETVPVTVATVVQRDVPITLAAVGNVTPMATVAVRSQITGTLEKVWFKEGDEIRQGQLLFTIDPRPLKASLAQAAAALARDEAQLRNAQSQAARYAELVKKDYVTREEYDRVTAAAESARATVAADRAVVDNARVQLSYTEIHAPIGGKSGSLLVHAGNLVRANDTTPLVTLNRITPVYVQFAVPESSLGDLKNRQTSTTVSVDETRSKGSLSFVDNAVDVTTGTIALKATFPNNDRALWPGQFVHVTMTTGVKKNAVIVPTVALQSGQKGDFVYVVGEGNQVQMRPVKIFRRIDQETILERGVSAGETIVTDGQVRLTPKSKVAIKSGVGTKGATS